MEATCRSPVGRNHPSKERATVAQVLRRCAAAVAALATVIAGLTGIAIAGAGQAAASSVLPGVGVQFHATWGDYTDAQRLTVLDELAAAHVGWVRVDVGWQTFEETGKGQLQQ